MFAAHEVPQLSTVAEDLAQRARRLARCRVGTGLDVHREGPVRRDELQRDLGVLLVDLRAVRQPDRDEFGGVPSARSSSAASCASRPARVLSCPPLIPRTKPFAGVESRYSS